MAYKTLSQNEQIDAIVQTYKANEMDLFIHTTNKERYERILSTATDQAWKDKIQKLLTDTNSRINEVQSILDATTPQLPSDAEIAASLTRIAGK